MTARTDRIRGFKEQTPIKHISRKHFHIFGIFCVLFQSCYMHFVTFYQRLYKYYQGHKMKGDEIGRACSIHDRGGKYTILVREPKRGWEYSIKTDGK